MTFRTMSSLLNLLAFRRAALAAFAGALAASAAPAATLTFEADLHLKPDDDSPIVGTLPAGTTVNALIREELAGEGIQSLPAGWVAIRFEGPLYGYALNRDIGKDFTVKPGAVVRAGREPDAPVFTMVTEGDRAEAIEPMGNTMKVVFRKPTLVYLNPVPPQSRGVGAEVDTVASQPAPTPTVATPMEPPPQVSQPAPAKPARAEPKRPTPPQVVNATPRTFQGYLTHTRRILGQGPKLDYQLLDERKRRIALLDLSRLLLTASLDSLEGKLVSVYGPGVSIDGVNDVVIRVENLRLAE